ncbi:hypothetical protein EJB05_31144, partial [Eragrostis curvula]
MQPRRQQQQSILSFLQKQPRREPDPAGDGATPEKPPRPPSGSIAGIMERLVRPLPPPQQQPRGRNQDASQVRHVDEKASPFRNQGPSNGQHSVLSSGLCNGNNNRVNLFSEQGSGMASFHESPKNSLRPSKDEFVRASTLFPEHGSDYTPLKEHPKKLSSESPNGRCIRATSLFEEFDVQTPSQKPSKRIFLGHSHDDTPLAGCGSGQTLLQHSSKKFSLNSANGEYARAATTFGLDSIGTPTEQPSKKLPSQYSDPLYIKPTNLFAELDTNLTPSQNHSNSFPPELMNGKHIGAAATIFPDLDSSPFKPETPAMGAAIPRLKRVREEQSATPLWFLNKMKSAHRSPVENKLHDEMAESARSKFEWLNPSNIRDANRRCPNDPLYDKSTLFIPPDALRKMSTSQKQYWNIKCRYMDVVLFFKVGKFYELYEIDAEIGQKELDWKMTVSGVGKCRQVGISESGIDDAVDKLVARGYKVGRIEQMESADQAKARGSNSVIERKLVNVSTPSTAADSNIGPDAIHLLALKELTIASNGCRVFGFAFLDYAALKIWVGSLHDDDSSAALGALLVQVSPREIIYETSGLSKETHTSMKKYASAGSMKTQLSPLSTIDFSDASQIRMLIHSKGYFKASKDSWLSALDSSINQDAAVCALGGLIGHLTRLMLVDALTNGEVLPYHVYQTCLRMDGQTLVNLEIFRNSDGSTSGTLYKHLNHCITAFGKRLLRSWICHPLKDVDAINRRLDIVEAFIQKEGLNSTTLECLRKIPDLERLLGRVRSTVGLSSTARLPFVGEKILKRRIKTFCTLIKGLKVGISLLNDLQRADISALSKVVEIPTLSSLEELINQFEQAIKEEFPNCQDPSVKDDDHNTLVVLVELFVGKASEWSLVINALSTVDVLRSFAAMKESSIGTMCRPHILVKDSVPVLRMKGLWHPYAMAESTNGLDRLVPNDLSLGQDLSGLNRFALLLTGPNMGGKSTIMRATCLAVILAQLGCYVPCQTCELTLSDSIFTRLGATDRIMSGESTFFVECTETASVLQKATEDSLVLLDELGRGTSTFDGYAIAYAVFRHLVERVRCRLLFATHYHPLTKEFASHPHVSLQHMACLFRPKCGTHGDSDEKELTFLYRLTSGASPESYGLQVATMAGLPKSIVEKASVAGQMMKSKIAKNFKSSEERAEFSTLHEEWLRAAIFVSDVKDGHLDDDNMDTAICISQELKAHFRKAR